MQHLKKEELTSSELNLKSSELRRELFNLRLQKSASQLEKPHRIRLLRKSIARIETTISQLRSQKPDQQK